MLISRTTDETLEGKGGCKEIKHDNEKQKISFGFEK
jgi:hypothetical protein